jgi:hypothetical protein
VKSRKRPDLPDALTTGWRLRAAALYRRFLDKRFARFSLSGLITDDEPVLLRQIYVPLALSPRAVSDQAPEEKIHEGARGATDWLEEAVRRRGGAPPGAPFPDTPTFFVSGEAGSGKTTLTTSIVTSLAGTVPDDFNRRFERFLPFPILLRDVPVDRIGSLDELLAWWLEQAKAEEPELAPEHVLAFLDHGYGILLFDGLDEVGSFERREHVLSWLGHRWVRARSVANATIVTARPAGFQGITPEAYGASSLHITPFSVDQIRTFLTKWFELRPLSPTRRKESVESLIERLVTDDRMTSLRALSRSPPPAPPSKPSAPPWPTPTTSAATSPIPPTAPGPAMSGPTSSAPPSPRSRSSTPSWQPNSPSSTPRRRPSPTASTARRKPSSARPARRSRRSRTPLKVSTSQTSRAPLRG